MGYGPLPDWLRKKRLILAINTFAYNFCVWRCLVIRKRYVSGEENQVHKRKFKVALNLAREYHGDNKLKRKGVRHTKHVHFESTAKRNSEGSMLHEPKKNSRKDPGSKWLLVHDKIQ